MDDNTSNVNDDESTTSQITAIKTSQTDFSGVDGQDAGSATVDSKVEEGSQGRGSFTKTSQQINGELSLCESDKVS